MQEDVKKAILQTLAYGDIFDYPLTKEEIWKFLISSEKIKKKNFEEALEILSLRDKHNLSKQSFNSNRIAASSRSSGLLAMTDQDGQSNLYHLPKRSEIISKRIKREKESWKKLEIACKIASILSVIPTIYLIGISGGVSMRNSDKNDDIDLFVVTKKNTLWVTRITLLIFLEVLGYRRKRTDKKVADKICLNMLLDKDAIKMPKERQDLYSAHEVVQMLPVFVRNDMYRKFINANKDWVKRFLPNAINRGKTINITQERKNFLLSVFLSPVLHLLVVNYLAKQLQLWFIRKHQTTEFVKDNFLAFHPFEYKNFVLKEYNKRLKKYEI
ncbi:MAG: hypothetical protein Q7K55_03070 [Candidatus Levybacteria bacterium]|nr:hypothetical protein [Candidatus Levybacteria bacterium]